MDKKRRRLSYLLRLWQAEENGAMVWRASLESVSGPARSGERRGFASLDELYAFLKQETAAGDREMPSL
jgi:hypothetical protein